MSDGVRQALISSLFPQGSPERLLVHVKTYKDIQSSETSKDIRGTPRYLCLTQKKNAIRLLKVKRNQNGTFSVSKGWSLDDIKQIQIIDAHQFSITLNKPYLWAVERSKDKMIFLAFLIDSCRRSATRMPQLVNIDESRIIRFLADPSAPSMGATTTASPIETSHATEPMVQSPVSHGNPYPPSPSASHNNNSHYQNNIPISARSVENQTPPPPPPPLSPKTSQTSAYQHQPQSPQQYTPQPLTPKHQPPPAKPSSPQQQHSPREDTSRYSNSVEAAHRDDRKERDRAREAKRERERLEKQAQEEKRRQKKAEEIQEKMAEQASLMNVEELLTDFNWKASGNAAALEKRLLGELHALEAANVHAIIQSDERVRSIVEHIDKSLEELDSMESWLSLYGAELNSMGDDIREIETQNRALQILNQNQHMLITELDGLLSAISIPRRCIDSLQHDPMDTVDDVIRIQEAAEILQKALKTKLNDGLQEMTAVQERLEAYNIHGNKFSERTFKFLKHQFEYQARLYSDHRSSSTGNKKGNSISAIVAHPHEQIEDQLIKYQGFNLWEKEMEPRLYSELQRCYAQDMAPLYERDIRELIDATRGFYAALRKRDVDELEYIFKPEESRPARALAYAPNLRGDDSRPHRYRHMLRGSVEGVMGGGFSGGSGRSSIDEDEKAADDAFAQMISQGIMLVCREQNYMSDLFGQTLTGPKSFLERGMVYSQVPNKSDLYSRRDKIRDVKVSKKILTWMEIIFETLEPNLVGLLEYGVKSDPTQAVSMMGAVEFQQEKWDGSDQEFALRLCKSILQRLTKMFENFIVDQVRIIEETKISSKKRKGILSFFKTFPVFAMRMEMAASNVQPESETRTTVSEAYEKIIQAMMGSLDSIARESDQTGDDKEQLNATIMYIENMHHMYNTLRTNKLHVLEKWIKHAKTQYDNSLNAYIKVIIRRPLGKLLEFFEGVEQMMRTSTPEEVSFHMNYNKAQLRRVITMYPPKEIKKSLEQLYKRVDKHFSEEEGLLQVVWRGIQEEFIRQHEKMEDLIRKCYPDAGVQLEFTIQDLLGMMSELARKVNV
ncbi:exocyst complex component Sec3-domain-containing protein [Gilbertella persicaria]|uniref:exocyst complex component Sec3-domain-containing protein n=1 Tax=Gilbertella persicaria TaxID=101096 RepID=UPI00221F66B5|nr:exocyst complex component Sec3-domain-containing protein [Gilbertella persicaria]KAI8091056.1 exocyst complex component Sec3-domain-containing protein [Gilbertella persicaria]